MDNYFIKNIYIDFRLLTSGAGHNTQNPADPNLYPNLVVDMQSKRLFYVKFVKKLLTDAGNKHKNFVNNHINKLKSVITDLMRLIESVQTKGMSSID